MANEQNYENMTLVGQVELSDPIADELSDLLTKKAIRMELLRDLVNSPTEYNTVEKELVPVMQRIEAVKQKITVECIPNEYRDPKYMWFYNGRATDGTTIRIYQLEPMEV